MVRNRAMRKARALQSKLANPNYGHWRSDVVAIRAEISHHVRRARTAHRQWREFRQLDAEWRAEMAAIDARYPIPR